MNEEQLTELYKVIKFGFENACWDSIEESIEIISEYIEIEDDTTEE